MGRGGPRGGGGDNRARGAQPPGRKPRANQRTHPEQVEQRRQVPGRQQLLRRALALERPDRRQRRADRLEVAHLGRRQGVGAAQAAAPPREEAAVHEQPAGPGEPVQLGVVVVVVVAVRVAVRAAAPGAARAAGAAPGAEAAAARPRLALHGRHLLPDGVAAGGLLEAEGDVGGEVGVGPGDDGVVCGVWRRGRSKGGGAGRQTGWEGGGGEGGRERRRRAAIARARARSLTLPVVDVLVRDAVHEQRAVVLLAQDHEAQRRRGVVIVQVRLCRRGDWFRGEECEVVSDRERDAPPGRVSRNLHVGHDSMVMQRCC